MVSTERLRFVPIAPPLRQAFAAGALADLLDVSIPAAWPKFPEAFAPGAADAVDSAWSGFVFVNERAGVLVGNGGFYGPPNDAGEVEFGYEIAPEHQNRGYATEAVFGFIEFAFADARVLRVVAHTLAQKNASNAVLLKAGLEFVEELPNAELGKVWRWQRARP
jgi:ribosomal-protein-alanine N-acetyltransferase